MPDYPDTPQGREDRLNDQVAELSAKNNEISARHIAKKQEEMEKRKEVDQTLHAHANEGITIPVICSDCRKVMEHKTGKRRDLLSIYHTGRDPESFGGTCEACKESKQFKSMCLRLSLPERYHQMDFNTYSSRSDELGSILSRVKELSSRSAWIVLMGKRGIGKTHLAISCLKDSYRRGSSGIYLSAASFFPYFVRSGFKRDEIWNTYIAPFQTAVLDDLGQGEASKSDGDFDERVRQEIGATVDYYYRKNKQLIITTNLESVQDMMTRYGSWAVDRIIECGDFVQFPDIPSMRPSLKMKGVEGEQHGR